MATSCQKSIQILTWLKSRNLFFSPRAPAWLCEHGFEWLFRLAMEPHRLWRRYLVYGAEFVVLATLEMLGLKRFT